MQVPSSCAVVPRSASHKSRQTFRRAALPILLGKGSAQAARLTRAWRFADCFRPFGAVVPLAAIRRALSPT